MTGWWFCDYGSRKTRADRRKIIAMADKKSALKRADEIANVRYRHGYSLVMALGFGAAMDYFCLVCSILVVNPDTVRLCQGLRKAS